jgi:hypothetical protein
MLRQQQHAAPQPEMVLESDPSGSDEDDEHGTKEEAHRKEEDTLQRLVGLLENRSQKKETTEMVLDFSFPNTVESFLPYLESEQTVGFLLLSLVRVFKVQPAHRSWRTTSYEELEQWIRQAAGFEDPLSNEMFADRGRFLLWCLRSVLACEDEGKDFQDLKRRFETSKEKGADFKIVKLRAKNRPTFSPFRGGRGKFSRFSRGRGAQSRGEERGRTL